MKHPSRPAPSAVPRHSRPGPRAPWFRWLLAASLAAGSFNLTGTAQEPAVDPAAATTSAPSAGGESSVSGALTPAKVAEEGDGDIPRALANYRQVLARYDAARKDAAEALFRIGELTRHQQPNTEARGAYERLVAEFANEGDWAARAAERLEATGDGPAHTAEGAGPTPEPSNRYGGTASGRPAMSPELMKRYGLTAPPGAGAGGRYGAGTRSSMSPELMRRYGLLGTTAEPALAAEAAAPATTSSASAPPLDPAVEAEIRDGEAQLSQLRSEAAQLNSQLREVRREIGAASGIDDAKVLDLLPLQLVKDPIFLKEFEDFRLQITALTRQFEDAAERADDKLLNQSLNRRDRKTMELAGRFQMYRQRLERQVAVLRKEIEGLKATIDEGSAELQKRRATRP